MKKVDRLLRSDNTLLESYFQAAARLKSLTVLLKQHLPSSLKPHCQVANFQAGCLSIQTDNAAWATQLRYMLPDIQKKLQALPEFKDLKIISYYVAPAANAIVQKSFPHPQISLHSAQLIMDTAEHIPGKLGEALRKIATRAKKE